ncbi:MAG: glycosyltransferase family 4 protein, partial [Pseudomonadales bacterium]|nr:glycosyltransferase family 4 protein [Pseudomonadales bacterium]
MIEKKNATEIDVILGNSNSRFSGVTSTMLQTLAVQKSILGLKVMGPHHLPDAELAITFFNTVKLCKTPLKNGRPRIFHARRNDEMIQALLLKKLFRCDLRIVFTSTAQRHHSGFTKWLMGQMDAIISTCAAAASYLETPPKTIIPHGVDTQVYYPSENRQQLFIALGKELGFKGDYGIGIFGRVREQKGVHLFVRAAIIALKKQPQFTAIITGAISADNQDFVDQLKQEIKTHGLEKRIVFLGEQPFDKIPALMRSVSLLAALSDNEGYGLTPLEALSSGTAVLTTKAGAWPEIVENGVNGYIEAVN